MDNPNAMRRLVLLLLVVLLPLQFAWGAVTSYCEHETGAASQHFGHHEHVHKGTKSVDADGKAGFDNDCGTCQAAGSAAIASAEASAAPLALPHFLTAEPVAWDASIPAEAPERPQWPRLA